ncbi:MAG: 3-oxoacid CoA-transferase subunit B [Alphaproteobacteria bacterium]|nr:3-oxoacid CoA-transferase subunit B [Alphaproteobacteria bacterium]
MSWNREEMAQRAALLLKDGYYINLGIGIPTKVANYVPKGMHVVLEGENGVLGIGPHPLEDEVDTDLVNASKQTITQLPFTSFFDSAESFAMIRGGHIDMAIMGAMQVSENGDIASWMVPGKIVKGMGGAMDLVSGIEHIVVIMEHTNTNNEPKLVKECTLPLTGHRVVNKVITTMGEFEFLPEGLTLQMLAPGVTLDELRANTTASFRVGI